jgi:hypothetical protein
MGVGVVRYVLFFRDDCRRSTGQESDLFAWYAYAVLGGFGVWRTEREFGAR